MIQIRRVQRIRQVPGKDANCIRTLHRLEISPSSSPRHSTCIIRSASPFFPFHSAIIYIPALTGERPKYSAPSPHISIPRSPTIPPTALRRTAYGTIGGARFIRQLRLSATAVQRRAPNTHISHGEQQKYGDEREDLLAVVNKWL